MRKIVFIISVFLLGNLAAQNDSLKEHRGKGHQKMKDLNLTPEQESKMKAIHMERKEAMEKRREENKMFRENLHKKTDADINNVLTPEQQEKFNKMKEERKDKMNKTARKHKNWKKGQNKMKHPKKDQNMNESESDSNTQ